MPLTSVPAVIAVSREPLIVYSAMIFAVMGLRSMYFVLDAMRQYLIHLEKAVTVLLFFIAFKLGASASLHLTGFGIDIDVYTSLMVIAVILGLGIVFSFIFPDKTKNQAATAAAGADNAAAGVEIVANTETASDAADAKSVANTSDEQDANLQGQTVAAKADEAKTEVETK